ncbi:MAG: DNA polymerase I [Chloroherpetonaceae bacterium]|nr:DNA polymerase I [Chloroherpetonaceae bacterium]
MTTSLFDSFEDALPTSKELGLTNLNNKPTSESEETPKLFLLDGMALVYRAYFALMPMQMKTKSGIPTGAAYGFMTTLLKILEQYQPEYLLVAFDTREKTFRHERFPAYKANRPAPPEDLTQQLPYIFSLVESYGIKLIMQPGFEADDIMGSLAIKFQNDCEIFLVTPDKDFSQLVNSKIKILKPSREDDSFDLYSRREIHERYGVYPEQFIDMLTLMGDSSDNVPGAEGVGPKTAAGIINEFGSLENLFNNIHQLKKPKVKSNILAAQTKLTLSKFLVTIKTDMDLAISLSEMKPTSPQNEKFFSLLQELEFKSFINRFKHLSPVTLPSVPDAIDEALERDEPPVLNGGGVSAPVLIQPHTLGTYHLIQTKAELHQLVLSLGEVSEFCIDTETTELDELNAKLVAVSISYKEHESFVIDCLRGELTDIEVVSALKPILQNHTIRKIAQNGKYDAMVLNKYGIEPNWVGFDTMLGHYILDPDKAHNMDDMAAEYFGYKTILYKELVGEGKSEKLISSVPIESLVQYSGQDADVTLQLAHVIEAKLKESPKLFEVTMEIEVPLVNVLSKMELAGVCIDKVMLAKLSETLSKEIDYAAADIYRACGGEQFNIDSPKQLAEVLFERLKLPPKKRTKTGYSTDVRVLEELAAEFPVAEKILEYRSLQKLRSTYVESLPTLIHPKTGRLHTSFNQTVASTGRLSSSSPNLQNIPIRTEIGREIRRAFIPHHPEHLLLSADYSQIELRIAAEVSEDETMRKAFQTGEDIHTRTAQLVFGVQEVTKDMRRKAKEVNFGVLYGIQPFGLAQRLDIPQSEAKEIIDSYKSKYPKLFSFLKTIIEEARTKGYVETLRGRRRYIADLASKNFSIRNGAERAAINMPIQGTAADMIKLAMIYVDREIEKRKLSSVMILQVHDELLFNLIPLEEAEMRELISQSMKKAAIDAGMKHVPALVEMGTGKNWLEAH